MDDDRYLGMIQRIDSGEPLDEATWLYHFDHQNHDARSGAAEGEPTPEFALVDHEGHQQTRRSLALDNGLLLVFARSADW